MQHDKLKEVVHRTHREDRHVGMQVIILTESEKTGTYSEHISLQEYINCLI